MIKWERKLIDFVEKYMIWLAVLFLSGVAFFMRRQNIWFYTDDYLYYFDMHDNNIQSASYYLFVRLVGYGFEIPLHGIKWLAGLADFVVAILAVLLCAKNSRKEERVKLLLLYGACLFTPVVYLRGCVWAQVDSVALACLLGSACIGEYASRKDWKIPVLSTSLGAMGVAIYPPFILLVIIYSMSRKGENSAYVKYSPLWVGIYSFIMEIFSRYALGAGEKQGAFSLINWLTYHPHTGLKFQSPAEWLWQLLLLFSQALAVFSLMAVYKRKISWAAGIMVQLILAVCFSIALGFC